MAKTYDTYKDSGIAWIGEIPGDWRVEKARHIFTQRNSKGNETPILLSATQINGMYPQHLLEGVVQVQKSTDLQTFKTVHKNDYVISLRSFQGGFEMSDYEGVCSPAYQVFYNKIDICHQYYKLLFKSQGFISMINSLVVGIREGKNIQYGSFSYSYLPCPPLSVQQSISSFLDEKCGEIDSLISIQEKMISELLAYKQSVITEAVTKGLDKKAKMKNSGVEWIGDIPEEWEVRRAGDIANYKKGPFGSAITRNIFVEKDNSTIKIYEQQNAIKKDWTLGYYYVTYDYFVNYLSSFEVQPGDIIVSCAGTIGEMYEMPLNIERGVINQALMRIRLNEKAGINKAYFMYLFDVLLKYESNKNSNGSAIKNIPPFNILKKIRFGLPPSPSSKP